MNCTSFYLSGVGYGLLMLLAVVGLFVALIFLVIKPMDRFQRWLLHPRTPAAEKVHRILDALEPLSMVLAVLFILSLMLGMPITLGIQHVADQRNEEVYGEECDTLCINQGFPRGTLSGITEVTCACMAEPVEDTELVIAKGMCLP